MRKATVAIMVVVIAVVSLLFSHATNIGWRILDAESFQDLEDSGELEEFGRRLFALKIGTVQADNVDPAVIAQLEQFYVETIVELYWTGFNAEQNTVSLNHLWPRLQTLEDN